MDESAGAIVRPTKGNGPDATNDRPAKTQTKYATDFIAQCASPASSTAGFMVKSGADIGHPLQSANAHCYPANLLMLLKAANESGRPKYRAVNRCARIRSGASNTLESAGNLPDSEVFSRPESFGFGRDGLVRKAGRMADSMFETSRPPVARSNAASGFQSQSGAETMTVITPKMGLQGNTPATSPSSIARRIAIEAALSLALFHVRNGDTHAAVGRSIRATSMLKQACSELKNGGAA